MGTRQQMQACKNCGRSTAHLVNKPNHILHLLLSVVTVGLWIPVWILLSVFSRPPECTVCGRRRGLFGRTVRG